MERGGTDMTAMIIVVIVIGVIALIAMSIYNNLIARKNQVENVFGSVDALLKKRYDLVPNLVATVKTYMKHEKAVLTEVTKLRA